MGSVRVQVRKDGSIPLPKEVLEALGAGPGSYLLLKVVEGRLEVEKTTYDPWTEGLKKKGPASFEEIMKKQKEGLQEAEKDFMEKLKNPPEIRPEDRHDFWD